MESIEKWLVKCENWVWGAPLLVLLISVGLYLTVALRGIQFRYLVYSLKLAFTRQDDKAAGDISQFQALMTALAGMIGIGSITGVATAIALGGLGSIFWMWVASLIGMASKYAEAILAVKYRTVDEKGEMCGGPMYYLEHGLKSKGLAIFFALVGAITALGTGNAIQANSIAAAITEMTHIDPWIIGAALAAITGITLLGGIKSIGKLSSWLVPIMAIFYLVGGLIVIFLKIEALPQAFYDIFMQAFTGKAAFGGFAGSTLMMAIQYGMSRSVFSTEAGLGTAPIAAAAAKTDVPGRQALISMSGVFITSMVVCTITGLVIAISGLMGQPGPDGQILNGSMLALAAFEQSFSGGGLVVAISLILFGYSTILGWAYYGEKCMEYLFGLRIVFWYRLLYIAVLIPGAVLSLQTVWSFANIMNGLMALPNLIGLFGLSAIVISETKNFERLLKLERKKEEEPGIL
ncbi:MAG TPA: sodium:alanine symporter family protein [Chlamydiales bacterium]|jgi:AGCS family alanine or glycine:cation symporter|nr:sodium:alanine symporter family protein [Chlamydiales bacterium]